MYILLLIEWENFRDQSLKHCFYDLILTTEYFTNKKSESANMFS